MKKKNLTPEDRAFIQGMAVAVANAVRYETWYPTDILGGVTVEHMRAAGCEEYDIEPIENYLKGKS